MKGRRVKTVLLWGKRLL